MRALFCQTHYRVPGKVIKYRTSAVDWWRIIAPAEALKRHTDWKVDLRRDIIDETGSAEEQYEYIGKNYDVVVSSYHPNGMVLAWMEKLHDKYGTKYVVDFDDDILNIPYGNPVYFQYQKEPEKYAQSMAVLDMAPYVTTTNKYLKKTYKNESEQKHIHVIPNYIDLNTYAPLKKLPHDTVNIGFQGSVSHLMDLCFTPFKRAIFDIMKSYPQVRFKIFGAANYDEFTNHPQVEFMDGTGDFYEYVEKFKTWAQTIDVGVAPLIVSHFTKAKSNIKVQEYGSQKIPCIATDIRQYTEIIDHGYDGMLAADYDEWMSALTWLVENADSRKEMGERIYGKVLTDWNIDVKWTDWKDQLEWIVNGKSTDKLLKKSKELYRYIWTS